MEVIYVFNVLIVEDEFIIVLDIKQKLKSMNCNVFTASSGENALKIIENNEIDMILMDIHLKGDLDGVETAIKIRDHYTTPIIYITGCHNLKKRENIQETEPYVHLKKPYENDQLDQIIKKIKSQ